ncbi:MAG: Nif3-like dinuclear metal center hexameric protein [Brevinema sp.]
MTRKELENYFNNKLNPKALKDATINGLQVEGKNEINSIAFAVDASLATINAAAEMNADALVTHHGLIWGGMKQIRGVDKKRIAALCSANINLFSFHLPLDIHPQLGNNAVLMDALGITRSEEIFFDVGYYGTCNISYADLLSRIQEIVGSSIQEMKFGPDTIHKIAFCTGAAGTIEALLQAVDAGADTLFTGETSSLPYHHAKELGINIICAGHYATEVFGPKALQQDLQSSYPLIKTEFIDIPTGW